MEDVSQETDALDNPNKMYKPRNRGLSKPVRELKMWGENPIRNLTARNGKVFRGEKRPRATLILGVHTRETGFCRRWG